MTSRLARTSVLVAFVVLGAVIGIVGGFTQAQRIIVTIFDRYVILPWGMILILVILAVVTRLATIAAHTRVCAWLFIGAWLAATLALAAESPSGDLALSAGTRQMIYLFGGVILCAAIATLPVNFRRGTTAGEPASITDSEIPEQ